MKLARRLLLVLVPVMLAVALAVSSAGAVDQWTTLFNDNFNSSGYLVAPPWTSTATSGVGAQITRRDAANCMPGIRTVGKCLFAYIPPGAMYAYARDDSLASTAFPNHGYIASWKSVNVWNVASPDIVTLMRGWSTGGSVVMRVHGTIIGGERKVRIQCLDNGGVWRNGSNGGWVPIPEYIAEGSADTAGFSVEYYQGTATTNGSCSVDMLNLDTNQFQWSSIVSFHNDAPSLQLARVDFGLTSITLKPYNTAYIYAENFESQYVYDVAGPGTPGCTPTPNWTC